MEVVYGFLKSFGFECVINVCEQVGVSLVNNEKNFEYVCSYSVDCRFGGFEFEYG